MSNSVLKRRNGFIGEKSITLPQKVCNHLSKKDTAAFKIYLTQIGYFPKASYHYRERRKGCEDNILIYCLQGKGHYIIGNKRYEVVANQFILLPATDEYMRYWADIQDPWTIYWVHFTGNEIREFNSFLKLNNILTPQNIKFNQQGIDIWNKMYNSLEAGYSMENLCNANFFLYGFFATFIFPEPTVELHENTGLDIVTQTIDFIRNNIEKKLTVAEIADHMKVSSSHLTKTLRKSTGMAPMEYFIHLKLQRACQLLYSENVMIKTVAIRLGYDDPYYFSRLFKRYMGTSPEQYRLLAKK